MPTAHLKQAEQAQRDSEAQFRSVFAHAAVGMVITDIGGNFLHVNEAYCRITGYSEKELLQTGFNFQRITPAEDVEADLAKKRRLLNGEHPGSLEKRYVRKDGATVWVRVSASLRRDAAGHPHQIVSVVEDISDRKQAEEKLRQSESFYRQVLESAPGMAFTCRPDGYCDYQSQQWVDYTGVPMREHIGDGWNKLLHPDDQPRAFAAWKAAVAEKGQYELEYRVRRHDGKYEWFRVIGRPIHDAAGRIVRWMGMAMNIEKLMQTEEELRLACGRLQTLFDHRIAGIGVVIGKENGAILQANDYYLNILGYTREELLAGNADWRARTSPEWLAANERALAQLRERGVCDTFEKEYLRRDGMRVPTLNTEILMPGNRGEILAFVLDITERKRAERELLRLNETLEQRVTERSELAVSRARQLQTLAVELIEAEERERQRIAELLHDDLQQLLAGAMFTLQAIGHTDPDLVEVKRLLEASIQKSRHLSHELSPAVLNHSNLTGALDWLCLNMRAQFGLDVQLEKGAAAQIENGPLKVFLFRAAQELLFNVVKHSGVNSARIELAESDNRLCVSVSDRGRGFDPSILQTYTAKAGLGLMSLRERASYIGGSLQVKSGPGRGSRITLCVPAVMDAITPHVPAAAANGVNPPLPLKAAKNTGIRILFADDHKVMRQGLIRLITGQPGIEVVGEASNGREAIELTRQFKPDVVVMDISMPEVDGFEATRLIKAELPAVRVIGLSMLEDELAARQMFAAGADALVSKTASSSELLKTIYGFTER